MMPLRPLVAFIYLYILRLGFLDGLPGYGLLSYGLYELMIDLKIKNMSWEAGSVSDEK